MSLRPPVVVDSQPLNIVVLTESLCPDCKEFITGTFKTAIAADGIEKIANITIVPFGNAREQQSGGKYVFTCQHGENECLGNAIENCLQAHVEKKTSQAVMVCLETKIDIDRNWGNAVTACSSEVGVDLSTLMTCANSDEGMQLTHQAAQNTDPQHQYVPWVTVNGVHDTDVENQIMSDLLTYACSQYKGTPVPACASKLNAPQDDQILQIVTFAEADCPYCQGFIMGAFAAAVNTTDLEKIANITIIPFGNAKETQSGGHYVYTCQHGPDECLGNAVLNCILNQHDKKTFQKALVCLETKRNGGTEWADGLTACSTEVGADFSQAMTCATGADGEKYVHQAALATDPAHKYVPWIEIGGVHDEDAEGDMEDDLVGYACANYKGTTKIAACASKKRCLNKSWNN